MRSAVQNVIESVVLFSHTALINLAQKVLLGKHGGTWEAAMQ